jgi:hypothetical protein
MTTPTRFDADEEHKLVQELVFGVATHHEITVQ